MENGSLETLSNGLSVDTSHVKGWGVDADTENDPTYPIKRHSDGDHAGYSWERPPQQPVNVEVLHSNERPNVSAAFGTTLPPSGLSGMIRRAAFRFSESSYGHWLPLMLADRINMVEGVGQDLVRGRVPNLLSEMGMKAEWRYNKKRVIGRAVFGLAIAGVAVAVLASMKSDSRGDRARDTRGRATDF